MKELNVFQKLFSKYFSYIVFGILFIFAWSIYHIETTAIQPKRKAERIQQYEDSLYDIRHGDDILKGRLYIGHKHSLFQYGSGRGAWGIHNPNCKCKGKGEIE